MPVHQGRIRLIDERFVLAAHVRGIAVHVWTIDDEAEMERLLDLGVDGFMTDRAELLRVGPAAPWRVGMTERAWLREQRVRVQDPVGIERALDPTEGVDLRRPTG